MGITCKPMGMMKSVMKKLENKLEEEKRVLKEKKDNKKS